MEGSGVGSVLPCRRQTLSGCAGAWWTEEGYFIRLCGAVSELSGHPHGWLLPAGAGEEVKARRVWLIGLPLET